MFYIIVRFISRLLRVNVGIYREKATGKDFRSQVGSFQE